MSPFARNHGDQLIASTSRITISRIKKRKTVKEAVAGILLLLAEEGL